MRFLSTLNNVKAHEWGLTIQQAYLFSWFYELPSWADKVMMGEEIYFFASKNKAVEELPLLTDKTDTMYRYYKQVEEAGLVLIKKIDGKDYIALTTKGKSWNFSQSEHSDKNPTTNGNPSENNSDKNPTYKDISINKDINNKENLDFNSLLIYYNTVSGFNCKVVNDKTRKNFTQRLKEGYTKSDIKNAIDNAFKDDFHRKDNFKYVTLEFISRQDKFDRYASLPNQKEIQKKQENGDLFFNP